MLAASAAGPKGEAVAERHRLTAGMDRHAQKSAWEGVERSYGKLMALQIPLPTHVHYLAAQAALSQGQVDEAFRRLERSLRDMAAVSEKPVGFGMDPRKTLPEIVNEIDGDGAAARLELDRLKSAYGYVDLEVHRLRLPALIRLGGQPFIQTEREVIKRAQGALSKDFVFKGRLPSGKYMVDGEMFQVGPNAPIDLYMGPR